MTQLPALHAKCWFDLGTGKETKAGNAAILDTICTLESGVIWKVTRIVKVSRWKKRLFSTYCKIWMFPAQTEYQAFVLVFERKKTEFLNGSAKGQIISKWFFGVFYFLQKTNENKSTWGVIVVKSNSFVRFLEEIKDIKNLFEIIWPLVVHQVTGQGQVIRVFFSTGFFSKAWSSSWLCTSEKCVFRIGRSICFKKYET